METLTQTAVDFSLSAEQRAIQEAARDFVTRSGTCAQTFLYPGDTLTRTGDYMGAQVNPNDQTSFWFAGERATKLGGLCQANSEWDTRIVQVTP